MIIDEKVLRARKVWLEASNRLGFKIITPFSIELSGKKIHAFAFLPHYGSANGVVIDLTSDPDFQTNSEIIIWATVNKSLFSFVNVDNYQSYNEDLFVEMLEDWRVK